jgi:glycosyltransferase involved in cell wall biosynthesis
MSSVINNLVANPPKGWEAVPISTHSRGIYRKLSKWLHARRELKSNIHSSNVDLVHVHVTHSLSWWRKLDFLRICELEGVPSVVHIHSGRFDKFCDGLMGPLVKLTLEKENRGVILLEERWRRKLKKWLPQETQVIRNFSQTNIDRSQHSLNSKIKLLMLSRKSNSKGLNFAIEILRFLKQLGTDVELTITGEDFTPKNAIGLEENLDIRGWVTENQKHELIQISDFLISPSEFEGSSMSVIESIVSGLPCIVSPASSETVMNEGQVVSERSPELWGERILQLHQKMAYEDLVAKTFATAPIYGKEMNIRRLGEFYEKIV